MPYTWIEMSDFDTDDMIKELESRGYIITETKPQEARELYSDLDAYGWSDDMKKRIEKYLHEMVNL